jgi:hypothetical protein
VTVALADFPPAVAVIVAVPAASAVSAPVLDTETMVASLDCQLVVQPPEGTVPEVLIVAASDAVSPTTSAMVLGATAIAVTVPVFTPVLVPPPGADGVVTLLGASPVPAPPHEPTRSDAATRSTPRSDRPPGGRERAIER